MAQISVLDELSLYCSIIRARRDVGHNLILECNAHIVMRSHYSRCLLSLLYTLPTHYTRLTPAAFFWT